MMLKTHIANTVAIVLPISIYTDTLSIPNGIALFLGIIFPDVNEKCSYIGSRFFKISITMQKFFKIEDATHSIFGLIVAFLTTLLFINILNLNVLIGVYYIGGYTLHIIQDAFSHKGIRLFSIIRRLF